MQDNLARPTRTVLATDSGAGDIQQQRRRSADNARDDYDFGGKLLDYDGWICDRDNLTCGVEIGMAEGRRHFTFRVSFYPNAGQVMHVAVAERMALL